MLNALLIFYAVGITSSTDTDVNYCGYLKCNEVQNDMLNIHIVPYSHLDIDIGRTVDEIYYGSKVKSGVQYILTSVVHELLKNPERRFIIAETAYFWQWYSRQRKEMQRKVNTLVDEERLQFVGGAWTINDEASTHYQSIIDQFTWGLRRLKDTFGDCSAPQILWQVDNYGHSREMASLASAMGYRGMMIGRIDFTERVQRLSDVQMDVLWRGDAELGNASDIFASVLYNTYLAPPGFCFDVLCDDEPIIDDPHSLENNLQSKVEEFVKYATEQARHYETNNIMIIMGDQMAYQNAFMWYKHIDLLVENINKKSLSDPAMVKAFYSTPNCYLRAVRNANPILHVKQDDFFPISKDGAYYSGMYSSRPSIKYLEREANRFLQMLKQLLVLGGLDRSNMVFLDVFNNAMGLMQHDDAISGTAPHRVAVDYVRIVSSAMEKSLRVVNEAFNKYLQRDDNSTSVLNFRRCDFNESSCPFTDKSEKFVVQVYNLLAWKVLEPVRIPVASGEYEVYGPTGSILPSQLADLSSEVRKIPSRTSSAVFALVFLAELQPVSYKSFYVKKIVRNKRYFTTCAPQNKRFPPKGAPKSSTYKCIDDRRNVKSKKSHGDFYNGRKGKRNQDVNKIVRGFKSAETRKLYLNYISNKDKVPNKRSVLTFKMKGRNVNKEFNRDDRESNDDDVEQKLLEKLNGLPIAPVIQHKMKNIRINISFAYYTSYYSNTDKIKNEDDRSSSDAYIFTPNITRYLPMTSVHVTESEQPIFQEMRLRTDAEVSSAVRVYEGLDFIEHDWIVGPINVDDNIGKEYVIKYTTDVRNKNDFYTDSNGRQMIARKTNNDLDESVSGNYYPVTNKICIKDGKRRLTVLTDRPEGGTSLKEGQIELMVHRRFIDINSNNTDEKYEDNEGAVVSGLHRILINNANDKAAHVKEKKMTIEFHLQPVVLVADASKLSLESWHLLNNDYTWVREFPQGIHLLTIEPITAGRMIIRLENYLETSDQNEASITVDLDRIFKYLEIDSFQETNLAGNVIQEDHIKWTWKNSREFIGKECENGCNEAIKGKEDNGRHVVLKPRQIRTFLVIYSLSDPFKKKVDRTER